MAVFIRAPKKNRDLRFTPTSIDVYLLSPAPKSGTKQMMSSLRELNIDDILLLCLFFEVTNCDLKITHFY